MNQTFDRGTRLRYGAIPLSPAGSMVPRAETSLAPFPKQFPSQTPFVGVRGKALALRYPGAPLKPRGEGEEKAHLEGLS